MEKASYFVCYKLDGLVKNRVVTLQGQFHNEELVEKLRNAIHPNHPGDPSDNMKPQFSKDCVLINFKKISS